MIQKKDISGFLRKIGLLSLSDMVVFYSQKLKNREANKRFREQFPDVALPLDYLMYESFQLNYQKYYVESVESAHWLASLFGKHTDLNNKKILDWGCGPGRVIRHMPSVFGQDCSFYGTDYNKNSIEWCRKNLPNIAFNHNGLDAQLPYGDNYFDCIYGISIFTHLSEAMHHAWTKELLRVLKPGGIMLQTMQGNNFVEKLTESEQAIFKRGEIVVRGKVKEGHRMYSAFHPEPFVRQLFSAAEIIDHIKRAPENGRALPQDVWMVKKRD